MNGWVNLQAVALKLATFRTRIRRATTGITASKNLKLKSILKKHYFMINSLVSKHREAIHKLKIYYNSHFLTQYFFTHWSLSQLYKKYSFTTH